MKLPLNRPLDARKTRKILSFNRASRWAGHLADAPLPSAALKILIRAYSAKYRVDLSEVRLDLDEFKRFGDFFARELKEGMRPVELDPDTLVSPADGRLQECGVISDGRIMQVKGRGYSVEELLGDRELALSLEDGAFATIYLSPSDYHRVHAPLDGDVAKAWTIPGALYSVSPRATALLDNLFVSNERLVVPLHTPHGTLVVVLVAAAIVGKAVLSFSDLATNQGKTVAQRSFPQPVHLRQGEELGAFRLGSTVVLLTPKGWKMRIHESGESIRMGQRLMSKESAEN